MISITGNGVAAPVLSLVTWPLTLRTAWIDVVVDVVLDDVVDDEVVVVEFDGPVVLSLLQAAAPVMTRRLATKKVCFCIYRLIGPARGSAIIPPSLGRVQAAGGLRGARA
jgi:hypothetical protein